MIRGARKIAAGKCFGALRDSNQRMMRQEDRFKFDFAFGRDKVLEIGRSSVANDHPTDSNGINLMGG
jgi:hypothetical protein